jgi:hypothetical protein
MRRPSFAAVLDDALARAARAAAADTESAAGATAAWAWRREPPLGSAFLFARPLTAAVPRWPAAASQPAARAPHRFTDDQRLAFARLLDLGAELSDGFTADELRREYRGVARHCHPDAHADAPPLERAQWARLFIEATDDYRCLCRLVETRH